MPSSRAPPALPRSPSAPATPTATAWNRGGNRQINATIHRIAITRLHCHPETQDYIARKRAEGKTTKDALRCLKRHLTRRVWHLLQPPPVQDNPASIP
jgi:hypothetical protein